MRARQASLAYKRTIVRAYDLYSRVTLRTDQWELKVSCYSSTLTLRGLKRPTAVALLATLGVNTRIRILMRNCKCVDLRKPHSGRPHGRKFDQLCRLLLPLFPSPVTRTLTRNVTYLKCHQQNFFDSETLLMAGGVRGGKSVTMRKKGDRLI